MITWLRNSDSFSRQYRKSKHHPFDWPSTQLWSFLEPSWYTLFLCPNSVLNLMNQFKFNSLLIIFNINKHSDIRRLGGWRSVLRLKIFPHRILLPLLLGCIKSPCNIWKLVPWIGNFLQKLFATFYMPQQRICQVCSAKIWWHSVAQIFAGRFS